MKPRHCVVIGGEGYIGRSLVLHLLKIGNWIIRIVDSPSSFTDQNYVISTALNHGHASYFQLDDLCDNSQLVTAIQGTSIVFYIEYVNSYRGDYYQCYMHMVQGAKNVINACVECKVERLIYNNTSDVVFSGGFQEICYADESLQYPWKYIDMLNDLRAQAESLILSANEQNGLLTCSLRPSNVFGPDDTYLMPSLIKQANSSLAKIIFGDGDNMCDFTYVENVAHSHICAAIAKDIDVGGKAFFITNLEPVYYWEFVSRIYKGLGYQRPIIKFPTWMHAYILLLLEWLREQLEYNYSRELLLAQLFIQSTMLARTYSCIAAEKHLGYSPIVSLEEGLTLTLKSFPQSSKEKYPTKNIQKIKESKVEKLLKSGKVADILLWRNERETFTWFLIMALLYYWFLLGEMTFITSAARLLLLAACFLFVQNFLPLTVFGFTIRRMSWSNIHIPDSRLKATVIMMTTFWNKGIFLSRSLTQGKNWATFIKASISLYLLELIFSISSCYIYLGLGTMFSFTSFFTYEQYEEEIDGFVRVVIILSIYQFPRDYVSLNIRLINLVLPSLITRLTKFI